MPVLLKPYGLTLIVAVLLAVAPAVAAPVAAPNPAPAVDAAAVPSPGHRRTAIRVKYRVLFRRPQVSISRHATLAQAVGHTRWLMLHHIVLYRIAPRGRSWVVASVAVEWRLSRSFHEPALAQQHALRLASRGYQVRVIPVTYRTRV